MTKKTKKRTYDPEKPIAIGNLPDPWTKKQFLFAKAYVGEAGCVGAEAARIAGFSHNSARQIASEILTKPDFAHVKDYITQELGVFVERFDISKEAILQKLSEMMHTDISQVIEVTEGGRIRLKRFEDMPPHALSAIKAISDKAGNTDEVGVTLHCPIAAMEKISKITKLYTDAQDADRENNIHIYLPDNGRDDPVRRKQKDGKDDE